MNYPKLRTIQAERQMISTFLGLDRTQVPAEGAFYDMENLSSDAYPVISPRPKRGTYLAEGTIQGMIAKEELCYIDGADVVIGGERVELGLSIEEDGTLKTLVSIGANIIILPDMKYINTADLSDYGSINASAVGTGYSVSEDGLATIYGTDGSFEGFLDGDAVKVSGGPFGGEIYLISRVTDSSIRLQTALSTKGHTTASITVSRRMPEMDFVVESGNRLWGCHYGRDEDGNHVNEIYACAPGDFKNWRRYTGLANDSYAVSVGSDGPFSGAVSYRGYPIFFKRGCIHRIAGDVPSAYYVQTTECDGVAKGSARSIAMVGETLFYQSENGICAYDGSFPVEIAQRPLGRRGYREGVAGVLGHKYYLSTKDAAGEGHLFVFDTEKGLWHREDDLLVKAFCTFAGELYYLPVAEAGAIRTVLGSGTPDEDTTGWMAETGLIGTDQPGTKYIVRLEARLYLTVGSRIRFMIQYDSGGAWEHLYSAVGNETASFVVPLRPRRCDHFRLRIMGKGEARVLSITRTVESGVTV